MAKHRRVKPEALESIRRDIAAAKPRCAEAHARRLGLSVAALHRLLQKHPATPDNRLSPGQAHQTVLFDATRSAYFSVVRELADGDWLLRPATPLYGYQDESPRPAWSVIAYSFNESFSGYQHVTYAVAKAANSPDMLDAFTAFCQPKADRSDPVQGLPGQLSVDNSLIAKLGASVDLIGRLGVEIAHAQPYEKARMGGVERTHRSRWDFERTFYMRLTNTEGASGYAKGEIKLSELNARCAHHLARLNRQPARFSPHLTKLQAWQRSAAEQAAAGNPITPMPENALATLAQGVLRRVDRQGFAFFNGQAVRCEGITSAFVELYPDPFHPEQLRWRLPATEKPLGTGLSYISALPALPRS